MVVGAVVVTFRRQATLVETLTGVLHQSQRAQTVVVVDNDADPEVERTVAGLSPTITYVASPSNVGYGAALALGMRHLHESVDPDWYWLLDDDSPPSTTYLERMLADAESSTHTPWVVANRGGRMIHGRIRHGFENSEITNLADFTHVDGALVSRRAVQAVGFPREDLFMMLEDLEYTTRIAAAGGVLLVPATDVDARHLGSDSTWRSFYQARNHLRIALDRRSTAWLWGWAYRMAALSVTDVRCGRWLSLRFRWWGAFHALRNLMGSDVHERLISYERTRLADASDAG